MSTFDYCGTVFFFRLRQGIQSKGSIWKRRGGQSAVGIDVEQARALLHKLNYFFSTTVPQQPPDISAIITLVYKNVRDLN